MDNDFLLKIAHSNYLDEELKAAFARVTSQDLVKKLEYLVNSLEVSRLTMALSKRLIFQIEKEDLKGRLIYFVECQKSDDQDIREVTASLGYEKIDEQELIDNLENLIEYQTSDDKDVRRFAYNLALLITPKKIRCKIDFLNEKRESKNAHVKRLSARLIKNIQITPSPKKIREIAEMIIS
jgi:hypothetical protein